MGQDPFGNTYYEIPAQPELGKRKPSRWYNTADTGKKVGGSAGSFLLVS